MLEPGLPVAEPSPRADAASGGGAALWDFGAVRADRRRIEGGEVAPAASDGDSGPAAPEGDVEAAGAGARLRFAQAAVAADLPAAAGRVERVSGGAAVIRNGVQVELHVGDPVYKGDVVQTGSGAALTVKFLDGTVLGLSAGARVVIDRMAYASGSSSNSVLFNLVQGAIGLVAGRAAASGDFAVDTPVATMGVRGTAVRIEILSSTGTTKFSLLREPNGAVGSLLLTEKAGGARVIGTVVDARVALIVTALTAGEVSATPAPKSPEELRADGAFVRELYRFLPEQRQRRGSSEDSDLIIPVFDLDLAPDSIDLGDLAAIPAPISNLAQLERPLDEEPPDLVRVRGAATEDGPFVPLIPPADRADIDVIAPSRLPAGVTFESRTGGLRLDPSDPAYQHLAAGETITVTVQYQIAFGSTLVPATASWKVVGRNDVPVARNDRFAAADETQPTILDLRGNDRDIDRDGLTVVSWTAPLEGTVRRGAGGVVFDPGDDFEALSTGQTATVRFTYTIADGHGGTDTAVATVTVRGEGTFTAPAIVDREAALLPGNGQTAVVSLEAPSRTTTADADVTLSVRFGDVFQPPLNIIYVIDISGSTSETFQGDPVGDLNGDDEADTVLDAEIANLTNLTQRIRALGFSPEDVSVTLIPFSDDAGMGGGPGATTFGLGRAGDPAIQTFLESLDSGGGTNFEAALRAATGVLGTLDPLRVEQNFIYFLSDGMGTGSFDDELATLTGSFDAQISAVGVGRGARLTMLNEIDSTGRATRITTRDALDVTLIGQPVPSGEITAVELLVGGREIADLEPESFVFEAGVLTLRVEADDLARFAGDTNLIEAHVTFTGNQTVSTSVTIEGALPRSTDLDF